MLEHFFSISFQQEIKFNIHIHVECLYILDEETEKHQSVPIKYGTGTHLFMISSCIYKTSIKEYFPFPTSYVSSHLHMLFYLNKYDTFFLLSFGYTNTIPKTTSNKFLKNQKGKVLIFSQIKSNKV